MAAMDRLWDALTSPLRGGSVKQIIESTIHMALDSAMDQLKALTVKTNSIIFKITYT